MRASFAFVLAVILAGLIVQPVAAQDPIQILSIDTYSRTAPPGATVTFNWTVRNLDPVDYDIEITASAPPSTTVVVAPQQILALSQNRAASVRVNLTTPSEVMDETVLTLKVFFTALQGNAIVFVASRNATVTIPSIYAEKRVLGIFENPLPAPLDNEWGVFLLDVILWAVFAVATLLVVIPIIRKVSSRTKSHIDDIVIRIVRTPLVVLLFLYGTLQSLEALDRHLPAWVREVLLSVYQVALTIILLYIAYRLFKDVVIYLGKTISKKTSSNIDDVLIPLIEKIGLVVIGFVGLGLLLGYLNVDLTLFVAGGVVISMVLAFAAQDTISNFFSGIFLLTDRPFREGDIVIMEDGDWVEVRRIGMRTTRLFRFSDATLVTVPNNKLVNDKIANFTSPKDNGRIMKTFNVAYGSDPAKVKGIIQQAIDATPHIVRDDPKLAPIIRFDAMGESSLDFFVLLWIDDRANRFTVQDVLNTEIYNRLTAAGIDIPFPQRTVHLKLDGAEKGPTPPGDIEYLSKRIARAEEARRTQEGGGSEEAED